MPPLQPAPQPPAPDTTDATTTASDQTVPPQAPKPTKRVQPKYPDKALEREREGTATVYVTVGPGGSVLDVVVASESPEGFGFGSAARSAVSRWEFATAQPGKYTVTVRFNLE